MTQQKLKCLRRSALAALITAALSQNMAYADLSVGSIFGQTEKGVTISVKNLETGLKRELTSDNSGRFNFSQLPSGRYQVVANGVTREVNVAIGTGTPVNFSEETTERIFSGGFKHQPY